VNEMKTKKAFISLILIMSVAVHTVAQSQLPDTCLVSGYLPIIDGQPAANVELTITPVAIPGWAVSTRPITPKPKSDANGFIQFSIARNSRVRIQAPLRGYETGKEVQIPPAEAYDFNALSQVPLQPLTFGNPMTQPGDLIVGSTNGAPTRAAKGGINTVWGVNNSGVVGYKPDPVWSGGSFVSSFKGRTGAVLPAANDYSWPDISGKPSSFPPTTHTHTESEIVNLLTDLSGKQAVLGFTPENGANRGAASGYAPLDAASLVPLTNIPTITNAKLQNSSVTIGSTPVSLGSTAATIAGLTLTQPTIGDFTNAVHNHQNAAGGGTLVEAALAFTDVTAGNASTSKHGFLPKLSGNSSDVLKGDGLFGSISAGISGSGTTGKITKWTTGGSALGDSLLAEGTNLIEQRNSTSGQSYYVYNTYTDASNYERLEVTGTGWKYNAAGTGQGSKQVRFGTARDGTVYVQTNNSDRWEWSSAGHYFPETDNVYTIGESAGSKRPSILYLATALFIGSTTAPTCDASHRFEFRATAGSAGVKDIVQVCAKDASDVYAWRAIY
jgi:hypothetical protein